VLQGESDYKEPSIEGLSSALEENESQKLVFENRLGCDLYLRKLKDNFEQVELVRKDQSNLVHLPPPRFPDRFINVSDARPPRHFVAIHVSEAKGLPVNDDGNNQDYMCALRLVNTHSTDEQKALPQTARSRCVRPTTINQCSGCLLADAKWNEVFVFELLQQVNGSHYKIIP
jgi:vacuolar protein sorting-associated protein 13A/C